MFRRLFSIIKKLCNTGGSRKKTGSGEESWRNCTVGQIPAEWAEGHHQNDQSVYAATLWPAWVMTAWVLFVSFAFFFLYKSPYMELTA